MQLKIYHDVPESESAYKTFQKDKVLTRLQAIDEQARTQGLASLDAAKEPLIGLGMEQSADGGVTKNSYGHFHLSWLAQEHPEWPAEIQAEIAAIRERIQKTHGAPLKFLIWAGMGGSAEDKTLYEKAGLLKKGPKLYVLDSTDPAKLKNILAEMTARSGLSIKEVLKRTLIVAQALGMTSYEPVVNLQILTALFEKYKLDAKPNFLYMTLPGSILDQFAGPRGYTRVPLQLDEGNSTSGRHSSPLTRGSLYPLALAKADLNAWMEGTFLGGEDIETALRLASFLDVQGKAGRDKITLLLGKPIAGAGIWTKQNFEESLGKSEELGLKMVIDEKPKLSNYRSPKDKSQDRVMLAVTVKGSADGVVEKAALLRRSGYPVATITLDKNATLSSYMQFMHYVVFGLGYLRRMNFVTQPGVELYKVITSRIHADESQADWKAMAGSPKQMKWRGGITLYFDKITELEASGKTAPEVYASLLKSAVQKHRMQYGELSFFGDSRYSKQGQALRKVLDKAGEVIFRGKLKQPVDVCEGPAMNHSFHEMIIGHGKCLSTVLLAEKAEKLAGVDYPADYHRAQFLATQMALAERGRDVVAISLKDLEPATLKSLGDFFAQVAASLKGFNPLKCYHQ